MSSEPKHLSDNGLATLAHKEVHSGDESLPADRCVQIFRLIARTRAMEERTVKMSKSGQGHFWIGGPGEEAFNVCLGLQVKKGAGPAYDYLHLHYRNSGCLVAMGMPVIDGIRQMAMTRTDPHSMGRNFCGHYACREFNVLPVTSVIEVQFVMAPGTALMQKRHEGGNGVTIVVGGEAGTAEGDFASCMIWSSRPGNELPVLMITTNNRWGISTPASGQHSEERIVDRGKAHGIPGQVVDGNDPIANWHAVTRGLEYCRRERRPYMIEAMVSRLHGHSSSSGAHRVKDEPDCLDLFEEKLIEAQVLSREECEAIRAAAIEEAEEALQQALREPQPTPEDVELHTYAPSPVDLVYPGDYTGLPQ
jgi:2-oxoisovalerate dehydrogenase E1 component alpha subunit